MPATTVFASGTAADGALTGWTSITNVYADDGTPATREGTDKNIWYGNLLSFNLSAIPVTSVINSATITAEWKNSAVDTAGPVLLLGHRYNSADVGSATDTTGGTAYELLNYAPAGMNGTILTATGAAGFWAILRFRRTDNTAHTASVDYVKIAVDYSIPAANATVAEAVQVQVIDVATVGSKIAVTTSESAQLQVVDAAEASVYLVTETITPSEQVQLQVMDAVSATAFLSVTSSEQAQLQAVDAITVGSIKAITPAENSQLQVVDSAEASIYLVLETITASEQTQLQVIDVISASSINNVTTTEAAQIQVVDSASASGIVSITPAECIQVQVNDGSLASSLFALVISESVQAQVVDEAIPTASSPGLPTVTPAECIQIQIGDESLVSAFFELTFAEGYQTQLIDALVATEYVAPLPEWVGDISRNRLYKTRQKVLKKQTYSTLITR